MTSVLRAQFTSFGLKHGLAGVLSIFQNTSLRRYYHAKGLDVFEEVHRLKLGEHHDGIVLSVTDRLASRLDAAIHRMSILRSSKAHGKEEGQDGKVSRKSNGRHQSKSQHGTGNAADVEQGVELAGRSRKE